MCFISALWAYLFSYNTGRVSFGWAIDGEYVSELCMESLWLSMCFYRKGVASPYVNREVKMTLREHIIHFYHHCSCQRSVQKFRRHFWSPVSVNALYGWWWRMFGFWKLQYVSIVHQALVSPKEKLKKILIWCPMTDGIIMKNIFLNPASLKSADKTTTKHDNTPSTLWQSAYVDSQLEYKPHLKLK